MRLAQLALIALLGSAPATLAGTLTQTDWSLGEAEPGPVVDPGGSFDAASGIAWRSIPGQLSLGASALTVCPEHLINDAYYTSFGIEAADIDGDGDADVVGTAEGSGLVAVWLNSGTNPVSWDEQVIDNGFPGADGLAVADIDSDGRPDVVCTASGSGDRIAWWRNDGQDPIGWTRQVIDADYPDAYEVSTTDVDQDGHLDVLCASWADGAVAWWHNDGQDPIGWTKHVIADGFPGAHSAWGADFDNDGDTDIAGTGGVVNEVAWWRNDGGNPIVWTKHLIRTAFTGGRSVHSADLDADGDADLVGTAWTHEVTWWRNEGGDPVQWTQQVIDANFNGGHFVWVADIDGNGHLDVLGAACNAGDVVWFGSDGGDPIVWTRHVVDSNFPAVIEARPGDLDGDGALDILGTSYTLGAFSWWEVTQFVPAGALTSSILDLQEDPALARLDWEADQPAGTELRCQVRCGEDPEQMGEWSLDVSAPSQIPGPLGRYLQYRVRMETADAGQSPILRQVSAAWWLAAGSPEPAARGTLRLWMPNPIRERGTLRFSLPTSGQTSFTILNPTGGIVTTLHAGRLESGVHELLLPALAAGVHFYRLTSGRSMASGRVVVVK